MSEELLQLVTVFGPVAALAIFGLFMFASGRWHSDREFRSLEHRADKYEDMVLKLLPATRDATEIAKEATGPKLDKIAEAADELRAQLKEIAKRPGDVSGP